MNLFWLFLLFGAWRWLHIPSAGSALIAALESPDENRRLVAGMLLIRSSEKATPLIRAALQDGRGLPWVLRVAGDANLQKLRSEVERFTSSEKPEIVKAAREALQALDQHLAP